MSHINYEKFHQFINWWKEQNKKNPWKFWTCEIYSNLIKWFRLEILEQEAKWKKSDEILKYLKDLIEKEEDEMYKNI